MNPLAALFQDSRPVVSSPAAAKPVKRSRSSGLSTRFAPPVDRTPAPADLSTMTAAELLEACGGYQWKEVE